MQTVALSIRDFALPSPRTGSIEALSGYGAEKSAEEGKLIHRLVQQRRSKAHASYRAEEAIEHFFEREDFRFEISGRMDGFFDEDPPKIEEIKCSFNASELLRRLEKAATVLSHPYILQLATYGYFHYLRSGRIPGLTFHLASTRNMTSEDFEIKLDVPLYETWLERRLAELVEEAQAARKRTERRKRVAKSFPFPFDRLRQGQDDLIRSVGEALERGERMLIQAPTGLGKTAAVFHPVLKEALSRGQQVLYVTPKNSQHSVAEDAIARFQETGTTVRSMTLTAKSKICFKNEPLCNPEYCEYARDYYAKVQQHGLLDLLARKRKLKAKSFREVGEAYEVCPFELQLDSAADADAIICDYNYVFAPRAALSDLGGISIEKQGSPNLVIDEAHNLPSRAMDYYSPSLSSIVLERMREDVQELPLRFRTEVELLLDSCIRAVSGCAPEDDVPSSRIDPPAEPFLDQDTKLRAFLSRYLESDVEIKPRDVVLRLCFYWTQFTEALEWVADKERKEFFTTFRRHPTGGIIKITCCDASEMIRDRYDSYEHVVGFSATLKPFDYYAKLSGLDPKMIRTEEFKSPFSRENRKLLIIPQISTKYSDRQRNYPRIADTIAKIASLRRGNYFAFFPSFDFMERVREILPVPEGFTILKQEREMKAPAIEKIIEHLRGALSPTIVFAVQGGVFSEGVDYPGDTVIGAFVVGPPLPSFDLEREEMRKYYDENYGLGFDYAYTYPAMAKAVQAAGRVIRSETDRGLIVLMDSRFVQPSYSRSMPSDWFAESAQELVSNSILSEVASFWGENP